MALLLQLHGDLPEHFPDHERRLFLFGCRRRTCRRKDGSIRAIRGVRALQNMKESKHPRDTKSTAESTAEQTTSQQNLGDSLFATNLTCVSGAKLSNPFSSSPIPNANPFSSNSNSNAMVNNTQVSSPFDALASKPSQRPSTEDLPETSASKVRISLPPTSTKPSTPPEPWPENSQLPSYPRYHLDAEKETLDAPSQPSTPVPITDIDEPAASGTASSGAIDDADAFESTIDKAFQRFADCLAQNPLQVLRYEYKGTPLLYSKTDAVGKLLAPHQSMSQSGDGKVAMVGRPGSTGMPRCQSCGAGRVFELQLAPQAITEMEVEEMGLEGMDWGTIIMGVCQEDCQPKGTEPGEAGYLEEWVGVQWEEVGGSRR